jgi:hypothetical protein
MRRTSAARARVVAAPDREAMAALLGRTGLGFHVLRVAPRRELAVVARLAERGVAAWTPRSVRMRRAGGGGARRPWACARAPGYVLAAVGPGRWADVFAVAGVLGVLGASDGREPDPLRRVWVEALLAIPDEAPAAEGVAVGQAVTVAMGRWAEVRAVVVGLADDGQAEIAFEMLRAARVARVPATRLAVAC